MNSQMEFKMTAEIKEAMAECKWNKISKITKDRIYHAQMMRELEAGPMGHKISRLDRATGKPMGAIMNDGNMIRHENELRKFCLFIKNSTQENINKLLSTKNSGITFGGRNKLAQNHIQDMYEALFLKFPKPNFGKIGGRPNDWKIGWMGSRWRDVKVPDRDSDGKVITGKYCVMRAAYYGPRSNCVNFNKQNYPNDKTSHFIIFERA